MKKILLRMKKNLTHLGPIQWGLKKRDIIIHKNQCIALEKKMRDIHRELKGIGVSLLMVHTPNGMEIKNLSKAQKDRMDNWIFNFNAITEKDALKLKQIFGKDIDTDYIVQIYEGIRVYDDHGVRRLADFNSKYVNISNGERRTLYQPDTYEKTIYIYGSCTARGTGCEDKDTIASLLQKKLLERYPEYRVVNKAIGCGYFLLDDLKHLEETALYTGDVVIVLEPFKWWQQEAFKRAGIISLNSSVAFSKTKSTAEWFTDSVIHTNHVGNGIISDFLFQSLLEQHMLSKKKNVGKLGRRALGQIQDPPPELTEYLQEIKRYQTDGRKNGAIVMNCNPFTFGHRYLIEIAAQRVDTLYIFVVQENKSFFPFEDRFRLVQLGTSDLENVVVIPSGKYVLSALTFPGYFMKDDNPDIVVDTSEDLRIFGQWIAPALGIGIRFAGEEPLDKVTRQYNESMRQVLPQYGVIFEEIPRKMEGDQVISASLVWKRMQENDFEGLKQYVPESTYLYLKERYAGITYDE